MLKKILAVICFLSLVLCSTYASAFDVTFVWDANTEPDLAGYELYQKLAGQSYDYDNPVAVIPGGTETVTITVSADGDYCWVLKAYDVAKCYSADSVEVTRSLTPAEFPSAPTGCLIIKIIN